MLKRLSLLLIFIFFALSAFCNDDLFDALMQEFNNSDISAKTQMVSGIYLNRELDEYADEIYGYVLQYVLDNFSELDDYPAMNNMIVTSLYGLRNSGSDKNLEILHNLFLEYPISGIRAETAITIGILGKGNALVIDGVNDYLRALDSSFHQGNQVDYTVISGCIAALMELEDDSCYPVLFSIMTSRYPEMIVQEAAGAFHLIPGDLFSFLYGVIENNPPEEKLAAFRAAVENTRLSVSELGQIAQLAFETGMASKDRDSQLAVLRFEAVPVLSSLGWTGAGKLAIDHFYDVYDSYIRGGISKARLLEAIEYLGTAGSSNAALVLGLQLSLINIRKERSNDYDSDITYAVITALGQIGDNAVFYHLLNAVNLSYGEHITAAAQEAIDRLRW